MKSIADRSNLADPKDIRRAAKRAAAARRTARRAARQAARQQGGPRPIIPPPRRQTPFAAKFGRNVEHFGSRQKPTPPSHGHLPHIILGLVCALTLCIGICLLGTLPKVGEVRAAEGGQIYPAHVLLHYADVHTGDSLWGFDTFAVEKQMKEYMPLLASARVRKHWNGDVSISAVEYDSLYYTCHNRNYYIFTTDDMEILCALPTPDEGRRVGAVYIGLPEVARVRVGESITYVNLPYAPDTQVENPSDFEVETDTPEEENAYVRLFIDTLMSSPLASRVRGMELSDRYNLYFVLEGNVRVSVGSISELSDKLTMAHRALAEREASGVDIGDLPLSVDVSDPVRVILRASPEVVIPAWGQS